MAGLSKSQFPGWCREAEWSKINALDEMFECCKRGKVDEVKNCIEREQVCVDESDDDGVTALQVACSQGQRNLNFSSSKQVQMLIWRIMLE
uniref:Uncharacterized protein n=1 Tax=Ditylenchus dipsaci TaxID=166011 RepID=A0A915DKJ4_9BILA